MVHVPAKFRENTSMRFLSYSAKTKRDGQTDRQTDGRTDRRTNRQTDRGHCNISRPGPSAPREIINIITRSSEKSTKHNINLSQLQLIFIDF